MYVSCTTDCKCVVLIGFNDGDITKKNITISSRKKYLLLLSLEWFSLCRFNSYDCAFTLKLGQAYPRRFHLWIYYSKVESIGSCRFQIHLRILECIVSSEFTCKLIMKFVSAQFSRIWCWCLWGNFVHSKIFQSDRLHWSYDKEKYELITHAGMQIWIW